MGGLDRILSVINPFVFFRKKNNTLYPRGSDASVRIHVFKLAVFSLLRLPPLHRPTLFVLITRAGIGKT